MQVWHVLGNDQADLKADAGADIRQGPAVEAKDIRSFMDNLDLVQERLVAVMKLFRHRNPNTKAIDGGPAVTKNINKYMCLLQFSPSLR